MKVLCAVFLLCFSALSAEQKPPAMQVYFSPADHLDEKLIALMDKEKKSIHAAVYCLTHRGVIQALVDAKKRGVTVEVLIDPFSLHAKATLRQLVNAGISLSVWNPKPVVSESGKKRRGRRLPLMHDKFCIFGEEHVWTGSFNFTHEASASNQENAITFHDAALAKEYLHHFRMMRLDNSLPYKEYLALKGKSKKK